MRGGEDVLFYQEGAVPSGGVGGDSKDGRGKDNRIRGSVGPTLDANSFLVPAKSSKRSGFSRERI